MNQQILRKKFKHFHDVFDMSYSFIGKNIGVSGAYIGQWINEYKTLSEEKEEELNKYYNNLMSEVLKNND